MRERQRAATDGRVPGQRGLATRERFLRQTASMLADTSYRDLKVVDIARASGTSPATFYQYFSDAEDAVLALAEELAAQGRKRLAEPVIEGDWSPAAAYGTCAGIASAFLAFWSEHGALLAVIDLAALEGDRRFRAIRTNLLSAFTEAIEDVVAAQARSGAGSRRRDPSATAAVLVAMLAHVSAHRSGIEAYGPTTDAITESMAGLLHAGVTGAGLPG